MKGIVRRGRESRYDYVTVLAVIVPGWLGKRGGELAKLRAAIAWGKGPLFSKLRKDSPWSSRGPIRVKFFQYETDCSGFKGE